MEAKGKAEIHPGTPKNERYGQCGVRNAKRGLLTRRKIFAQRDTIRLSCLLATVIMASLPTTVQAENEALEVRTTPFLGFPQLLVAGITVLAVGGGAMYFLGLKSLARQLLVSILRCTVQLYILGSLVLDRLFSMRRPWVVFGWILLSSLVAAHESANRVEYTYPRLRLHLGISIIFGCLSILVVAVAGGALGHLVPWYSPRTLISVGAMLLHNALTASSLGGTALTREFALHRDQIELRLSRGATVREAALPLIQSSLLAALTPTINALATIGIVAMPGMMTGQILAGQSAQQASAYQVMIMFLITASACNMVLILAGLITQEMFDLKRQALKTFPSHAQDELKRQDSDSPNMISRVVDGCLFVLTLFGIRIGRAKRHQLSLLDVNSSCDLGDAEQGGQPLSLRFITQKDVEQLKTSTYSTSLTNGSGSKPETTALLGSKDDEPGVLTIEDLLVKRSNVSASFSIHSGERVGVSGRSGVGKSQLLRTISGLEEPGDTDGIVSLSNMSLGTTESPVWRRHVVWVSQDRPTIGGTPNDFYEEVKRYHSHRAGTEDSSSTSSPTEIAAEWGLAPAIMDRPWSSLSGGEAQRASLAIALALKPKALLADEPTSACDEATARKMEATLACHDIPMLIVTHSKEQLERFCTHHLELK